jgi:hypothetical protein
MQVCDGKQESLSYSQLKIINDGGIMKTCDDKQVFTPPNYMAINFFEVGKVSLIRLTNIKASMKIIEKMTQKYMVSFHFNLWNRKRNIYG